MSNLQTYYHLTLNSIRGPCRPQKQLCISHSIGISEKWHSRPDVFLAQMEIHDVPQGTMEVHFSSNMPSCICHMEGSICDNFTLIFQDEESHDAYSDLDLETNSSDPDIKHLPSEEIHSFGQDINISDVISLSSPKLHMPFYRWRIVVRINHLRVQVCNSQICFVSLWCISGTIPKIIGGLTKELVVH